LKRLYLIILFLSAMYCLGACQIIKQDLHPLTFEVIASGIEFNQGNDGQSGFDTYADSPGAKAFAASVGKNGELTAWGKG
jgi:hypothetical protein